MPIRTSLIAVLILWLMSACAGNGGVEQTLVAENEVLSTQVAGIRATATLEADRMMATLEISQTQVRFAESQNQSLQATLVDRGFSPEDIERVTPIATTPPTQTPIPVTPQNRQNAAPLSTEEPTPGNDTTPGLTDIVMASGVREDDCAQDTRTQFTPQDEQIYVVARAQNIAAGTTLTSRWQRESEEVATFDFTPDFNIDNACVWFFIDQSDTAFTPGTWSVSLLINGTPASAPVAFQIVESDTG